MQELSPAAKEIINLLNLYQNNHSSWIESREIAIWAATVLFISICGGYYNIVSSTYDLTKKKILASCLPIVFLLCLFAEFIFIQFGTKNDTIAWQSACNRTIFLLVNGQINAEEFIPSAEPESFFPEQIQNYKMQIARTFRQKPIYARWLMPVFILSGNERRKLSNTEKEEGIIYCMMMAAALLPPMVLAVKPKQKQKPAR